MEKIRIRTIALVLSVITALSCFAGTAFANSVKSTMGDYEFSTGEGESEEITKSVKKNLPTLKRTD